MTKEALKLALKALETSMYPQQKQLQAITAIKEALANVATNDTSQERVDKTSESVHEPVQWGVDWGRAGDSPCVSIIKRLPDGRIEVVAVEYGPQRTWVNMTEEEVDQGLLRTNYAMQTAKAWRDGVDWAIKQLQERNT
jgi:hypothetical protein